MSNNALPDTGDGEWRILLGADEAALRAALLSAGRDRRDAGATVVLCRPDRPGGHTVDEREVLALVPFVSSPNGLDRVDLDAVRQRQATVVLIDGLAHLVPSDAEVVPDVEVLRHLGIEVISTLRVDEIWSLASRAAQLSPVRPAVTVPDRALVSVDAVDVVPGGSPDELVALAGEWVHRRRRSRATSHDGDERWPASIVVAFDADADIDTVIGRAADLARASGARIVGVNVRAMADAEDGPALQRSRELLEAIGADIVEVVDDSPGWALARVAEAEGARLVVQRGNVHGYLTLDPQTASVRGLDLYVVAPSAGAGMRHPLVEPAAGKVDRPAELPRTRRMAGWLVALIGIPLLTAVLMALRDSVELSTVLLLYLALTVAATAAGGLAPGLLSAIGGFALADIYFTRPFSHWIIADPDVIVALVVFVVVAIVVSMLVDIAARRSRDAARARAEATALGHLASAVLNSRDPLPRLLHDVRAAFGLDAAAILRRSGAGWVVEHSAGSPVPGKPADATDALSLGSDRYLALVGDRTPAEDSRVLAASAGYVRVCERLTRVQDQAPPDDRSGGRS